MEIKVIQPKKPKAVKQKVCAYARVSTDSEVQEDSLLNQTNHYKTLIQSKKEWEFAGVYSDQGISGFKEKRPGFQKMIADARAGKIDLILVKSISRFARNTETVLKFSRELKAKGVGIFFELQNINTLSSEGELMLTILAAFAQAESESNSGNVKTAIRQKFKQGKPVSSVAYTFGFAKNENDEIVIKEDQAEIVRLIFDIAEKGVWPSRIADYLNEHRIHGIIGEKWSASSVRNILKQEAYVGDRLLQKTYTNSQRRVRKNKGMLDQWYIEDAHPAIISREQWNKVQDILKERAEKLKDSTPLVTERQSTASTYPLSGKLYCPYCGNKLYHRRDGYSRYERWSCGTMIKKTKRACQGVSIPNEIAMEWGELSEPVVVFQVKDEYGMTQYEAYPKEEWEASEECPYELKLPESPKPEKPKKPKRVHHQKPDKPRYTRITYPLSGKLFCPNCGSKMTHKWDGDVPYWVCSRNRDRWRRKEEQQEKNCKGFYFPDDAAADWGEINEPLTVIAYNNEYGHRLYTAYPKEEYERSEQCPYRTEN